MSVILSQEEQREIVNQNKDMGSRHFYSAGERLCRAQARHLMKELAEPCPHYSYTAKRTCHLCWKAIWDEVFKEVKE